MESRRVYSYLAFSPVIRMKKERCKPPLNGIFSGKELVNRMQEQYCKGVVME